MNYDKLTKENLRLKKRLDTAINVIRKDTRKIERLNNVINDINYYIEQRFNEDINDTERAILQSIELISKGIIKVVKKESKEPIKSEI